MGVPLEEQETVIQFNRTDNHATIYTSDSTMMTKLDKCVAVSPDLYKLKEVHKLQEGGICGKTYVLEDKKMLSLRKVKKVLSEEQRKIRGEWLNRNQNLAEQNAQELEIEGQSLID